MDITRSLAGTLRLITPYDGDEGFMGKLIAKESPIEGLSARRVLHDIAELEAAGMLDVLKVNGMPVVFDLTARGRDYRWNRAVGIARAVLDRVFQLVMGASGGFVVYLLGTLLSQ